MAVATKKRRVRKKTAKKFTAVALGCDVGMTSMSVAAVGTDRILGKRGPSFAQIRWTKDVDYFERMKDAAKGHELILDAIGGLGITPELADTWIAVEEPFPMGMIGRGKFSSGFAKQQAQMQGAFLSSLLRYGFVNIFEINVQWWRQIVADALGITIHHTKYGSGLEGKMRSKEFAHQEFPDLEEIPDLIQHSKLGLIPRPENSKAKTAQPDDLYDAIPMALWAWKEMRRSRRGASR